ncbi:MAG TPA: alpha/beta hydrolase [Actinomycetes bacterium]
MTVTDPTTTASRTLLGTGIHMHHVDHGDPNGDPVVLIHGYSDSGYSFSRVLPQLEPGYRVHAVDLRGHGATDRPADGYGIGSLAADVVAFLDAVGIARASIVGHSLGTLVARRVAETNPERVDRLALIGAVRTPVNDGVLALHREVIALDQAALPEFAREFQESTVHSPIPEDFLERAVEISRTMPLAVWRAVVDGMVGFDDAADLRRISAPTLLLWGEHDAYFGRDEQDFLATAITRARLQVYGAAGHAPHWEMPEQVAEDLQSFLTEG